MLNDASVRDNLIQQGASPEHKTSAQFSAYVASEISKWAKVIKEAGIKAN